VPEVSRHSAENGGRQEPGAAEAARPVRTDREPRAARAGLTDRAINPVGKTIAAAVVGGTYWWPKGRQLTAPYGTAFDHGASYSR